MAEAIEILDDDATAFPIGDDRSVSSTALGKRKYVEAKDLFSDDDLWEKHKSKKKRKPSARHRKGSDKKGIAGISEKVDAEKNEHGSVREWIKDVDEEDPPNNDLAELKMPDYLIERRRTLQEKEHILYGSGLRLPPNYDDIYFSDDEKPPEELERRPKFDDIEPSRPKENIEMEMSGGTIPASIAQYLRDYQIAGVKFLHQKFVWQTGCILGDDMGLGKTVQVAAFLTAAFGKTGDERDAKRMRKMGRAGVEWYPKALIICPGSLIENWKYELNRWGWWKTELYHGFGRVEALRAARAGALEVMITTYGTYKTDQEKINMVQWDVVIADECHQMKQRASETTQAMEKVNALCRIGLTGTAIQNRYDEMWTVLNWTNPGRFGTLSEWNNCISRPLTVGQSHDATRSQLKLSRQTATRLVKNLLPPYFLRRMKGLIAHQLPKKSDRVVFCPLTDIQKDAYENFLDSDGVDTIRRVGEECECGSGKKRGWCCHKSLPNGQSWMTIVFPTIIALQKLSSHLTLLIPPSSDNLEKHKAGMETLKICVPNEWETLYDNRDSITSLANPEYCGKWKVLKKLLRHWHESGDKVLVFSHSVRLLHILQHLFNGTSYSVSYLDGSLSYADRQKEVDNFNSDPNRFVFLISTKAGGVGLNITSANKVVIFDPHWNPSYDLQAQDRAYRIGQARDVDVFRLVSAGTIEEIVYARQIYKQQQANIGYTASTERRYFKGVQQDRERKGEIFGLNNLFTFRADQVVLRDIVNKTNIAEAKAGVYLTNVDIEDVIKDENDPLNHAKQEDNADDEAGAGNLAALIKLENPEELIKKHKAIKKPKRDAVQAILASAGIEYTHENSEVIGSSKVEAQLSRQAELGDDGVDGQTVLFSESQANGGAFDMDFGGDSEDKKAFKGLRYKPPQAVLQRQFCSMAKEFGFSNATEFALVVESWTQEDRRNCLDEFYKRREEKLWEKLQAMKKELAEEDDKKKLDILKSEDDLDRDVKVEVNEEIQEEKPDVVVKTEVKEEELDVAIKKEERERKMAMKSSIFIYDDEDDSDEL